jgi:ADP-ribose pyrophosphatase
MATSDAAGPSIELLSRRLLARNQVYDIYLDDVVDRWGQRVREYLSIVPLVTDAQGYTGVAVLPVRPSGELGLVRVFRHPRGAVALEMPKGFIDKGESPRQAAARELAEETGFAAGDADLLDLGSLWPVPGVIRARIALYAALSVAQTATLKRDDPGLGEIEFFAPEEALRMADAGDIEEPCTLVALYRYLRASGARRASSQ